MGLFTHGPDAKVARQSVFDQRQDAAFQDSRVMGLYYRWTKRQRLIEREDGLINKLSITHTHYLT